jgi:hypothetical protein
MAGELQQPQHVCRTATVGSWLRNHPRRSRHTAVATFLCAGQNLLACASAGNCVTLPVARVRRRVPCASICFQIGTEGMKMKLLQSDVLRYRRLRN